MEDFKFKELSSIIKPKDGEGVEYLSINGCGTGYWYLPEAVLQYCADEKWEIIQCNAERKSGFSLTARRYIL